MTINIKENKSPCDIAMLSLFLVIEFKGSRVTTLNTCQMNEKSYIALLSMDGKSCIHLFNG
jgi:hypothetical protein